MSGATDTPRRLMKLLKPKPFCLERQKINKNTLQSDLRRRYAREERARLALPPSDEVEEDVDEQLGGDFDGGVDEVREVRTAKPSGAVTIMISARQSFTMKANPASSMLPTDQDRPPITPIHDR
ncbi:hypothetical protein EYF80_039356 [Liparis tanakae]|uniref:Uncharacterized protein n=1 Tax=Liparis tanakae TaxID=230148 RepID=A0A4Z2GB31_9TELE|nr:hypothetical protein EYF80_039356 [Liparis tanakae]